MGKGLAGCRVLITRAPHQASQLAALLAAAGAETVSIPTIEIVAPEDWGPLDAALREIEKFDWVALTSANAVDSVKQRMEVLNLAAVDFAGVEIAVVGPATARAAEAIGLRVTLMPAEAVAEKLAERLGPLVAGKKVLLPQARGAREVLAVELARAGAQVTVVEAYRNVVPAGAVESLRELFCGAIAGTAGTRPKAIAFTSSSTAENFFRLMEKSGIELTTGVVLASIGPVTTQSLRELGHSPVVEAEEHTVAGLVGALEKYFSAQ
jgi:uroporphyrinogen-III synthase